jgi:type I restriction enzyme S subunit
MYGVTAGKSAISKIDLTTNQACCNITVDETKADYRFIYYALFDSYLELENLASGAAQQNLNVGIISDFEISIPPLSEQKAIAEVLSSLDDKIDLLHRQNKTLEAMAEALFRQWFVEPCRDGLPDGWEEGAVQNYSMHLKVSIQPQNYPQTEFYHYSIPSFDNNKQPNKEIGTEIQSNKYRLEKNCILFSKLNPHKDKRIWLLQEEVKSNSICSTEFQVIKPVNIKHLYFLYGWLSLQQNYAEIASGIGGTSGSHQRIDPMTIFSYQCPIIPDELVDKFNMQIIPLFKKIGVNQEQILTLEKLRDTLLPKLMSGEVRVGDDFFTKNIRQYGE